MRTCPVTWDPGGPSREHTVGEQVVPSSDWDQRLHPLLSLLYISSPPHPPCPAHLEKAGGCPGISPPPTAAALSPVCLEMELVESPWI